MCRDAPCQRAAAGRRPCLALRPPAPQSPAAGAAWPPHCLRVLRWRVPSPCSPATCTLGRCVSRSICHSSSLYCSMPVATDLHMPGADTSMGARRATSSLLLCAYKRVRVLLARSALRLLYIAVAQHRHMRTCPACVRAAVCVFSGSPVWVGSAPLHAGACSAVRTHSLVQDSCCCQSIAVRWCTGHEFCQPSEDVLPNRPALQGASSAVLWI